jgi:malate synthase
MTAELYSSIRDEELAALRSGAPAAPWSDANELLDELVLSDQFVEFLTIPAYERLS